MCRRLLDLERFAAPAGIEYLLPVAIKKKPRDKVAGGPVFSR
jgi:hypothetical protein